MHIKKIEINGFATFDNFKLKLNKHHNLIVGTNGVGKTNLIHIISSAFNNPSLLSGFTNNTDNKYIKINTRFKRRELIFLNNLFAFCSLCLLYSNKVGSQTFVDFKVIKDNLMSINEFQHNKLSLIIGYTNNIICKNIHNLNPNHKKSNIDLATGTHVNAHNQCDDDCIIKKILTDINNGTDKISNPQSYFSNVICKQFKELIGPASFNKIKDLLSQHLSLNKITINDNEYQVQTIEDIPYMEVPNPIKLIDIYIQNNLNDSLLSTFSDLDEIMKVIYKFPKTIETYNFPIDYLKEKVIKISHDYGKRDTLFSIKNNDLRTFRKIQLKFTSITSKYFDVVSVDSNCILHDYEYLVSNNKKGDYYSCSNGEKELIDFLGYYLTETNNNNILLIDEPCTKLSSQNKSKLKDVIYKRSKNQTIIITHDVELIDVNICKNIIHFNLNGSNTEIKYLKNIKSEQVKLLFEHKQILFAKKILLIEGYTDYIFIKNFLQVNNVHDYLVIIMQGCGNKIWKILDTLEIKYKIIYDIDVVTLKKSKPDSTTVRFIKDRVNLQSEFRNTINEHFTTREITTRDVTLENNIVVTSDIKKLFSIYDQSKLHIEVLKYTLKKYYGVPFDIDFKLTNVTYYPSKHSKDFIHHIENHVFEPIFFNKFLDHFNQSYKEYFKNYDQQALSLFEINNPKCNFINAIWNQSGVSKIVEQQNIDEIIENIMNDDDRYYIWKSDIKDMEGIGNMLFSAHTSKFNKKKWNNVDFNTLRKEIINNMHIPVFMELLCFLKR
jgi:predicted ATP-dependent endonuclease of OLD family